MGQGNAISAATASVGLTVLDVEAVNSGKLFALVAVEIDIDGIVVIVHGVQAVRDPPGSRIEMPKYRDRNGIWRSAVTLPEEIRGPLGIAVLEVLVERGLAKRLV
jgi:stage V sporulation protein G